MALVTHHLQGYKIHPWRPSSWSTGSKLKRLDNTLAIKHKEKFVHLKCKSYLRLDAPTFHCARGKLLNITAFRGSGRHNGESGRDSGSKSLKASIKLSFSPKEGEESLVESQKANYVPIAQTSTDQTSAHLLSIQNLFKSWLTFTVPAIHVPERPTEEESSAEISEVQTTHQRKNRSEIVKAVLRYIVGLDAIIVIPLVIFVPWYLIVNLVYGAEISKELTPLWILGPLILALYIKMLRGIFALYAFSFKQTVKVVKNIPTYCLVAYSYIARGQLKEDIRTRLLQPLLDIKRLDFKEVSRARLKDLQSFLVEKYMDLVESIWPYYCRTIRFLKTANLI
ncbi:hypothetical protein LIER_09404 [Lithospermum erythrorhizon]|uniref:Embryo defective 2759 n=1 Tax=Lithospermum erythrorhizon TaxID=34254 RepID=A0AAV3PJW1_LITER